MIFVQSFAVFQASSPMVSCLQVVTVTPPSLVPDRIEEGSSSLAPPYPVTSTSCSSDSELEL